MNTTNLLISVIVPVYNVDKYLSRCIDSIIMQTYKNLQIILVDDGSTDLSGSICDEYANLDSRIVVIHKSNGGLSDARNAGIEIAKGEYYSFIDSDDYIKPTMIETMLLNAINFNCQIAICNMIRFSEKNSYSFYQPTRNKLILENNIRFDTLTQPAVCNKLFLARLFDNIRFPKGKYYEDTYVYHELLYAAQNVVLTGEDHYCYYQRQDSITEQPQYSNKYFDFIEAVSNRMNFLLAHEIKPYGEQACLSLYAAFSNMEKHLKKGIRDNNKYKQAKKEYKKAVKILMKSSNVDIKQKIRLIILEFFPQIHSKIY